MGGDAHGATVFFSNNYSTHRSRDLCSRGVYPSQHLYGAGALAEAGFHVVIREYPPSGAWHRLSGRAGWRLGDVRQLPRALQRGRANSVDFAAEPYHVAGLAALRAWHWRRQPLVAVLHAAIRPSSFSRRLMAGVDQAVCLSRAVQRHVIDDLGRPAETTHWALWGPDLDFAGYHSAGEDFVVSSGKTFRDVPTLQSALEGTGIPARIYGTPGFSLHSAYDEVLQDLQRAAVVAIPLHTQRLAGLSELADALALAKPVIVTRSPWLDLDVEKIGCGVIVEPGDIDGWRRALLELWHDEDRRRAMGQAGRAFAETSFNAELFNQAVVDAVRRAAAA